VPRQGIVSFAPNITETVFALGKGDQIVGVTRYCDYPREIRERNIPVLGGPLDPDLEALRLLKPERLFMQGKVESIENLCAHTGTSIVYVNMDSLESISSGIETLGNTLECPEKALKLRNKVNAEIDSVRDAVQKRPRQKVLIITGRQEHTLDNLYTVGGESFVSEIVEVAGGENIFSSAKERYFEASKESIVVASPAVIIEFQAGQPLDDQKRKAAMDDWKQMPALPAVRDARIVIITESFALRPGPRIGQVAWIIAKALYPDLDMPKVSQ
jgi:iron complex transport system substrate-binding protein